jgi:hypothetical protein
MAEPADNLPVSAGQPTNFLFYTTEDGQAHIRVLVDGQTCWMTQKIIAELFEIRVPTANHHIREIYESGELTPEATIRDYLIVQEEGGRQVARQVTHYNLDVILAVGYRVRSMRGTQFRRWATRTLREFLVKGFVLDDARLKACEQTFGQDYFDELLERIREIRASERRFYQKITDIYAQCSVDYDAKAPATREFFAAVQNKLEWAITRRTAAEIIHDRADAAKPNMGLTTWKNAPAGKVRRADVTVAKNYLTEDEIRELNRVVTMYLDYAEDQARRRQPTTMAQWAAKLDAFLEFNDRQVLQDAGRIEKAVADRLALEQFDQYQQAQRQLEATEPTSDFDRFVEDTKRLGEQHNTDPQDGPS